MRVGYFRPRGVRPEADPRRNRAPIMVLACALWLLAASARGQAPDPACEGQDPAQVYQTMKTKMAAVSSYATVMYHETFGGTDQKVYAKQRIQGRYVRDPLLSYEKRVWMEASFPEQAGVGYQEIYDSRDDLTRLIMPGALKAIGVVTMFPEDPKADYINGENSKRSTIWNWIQEWDRMASGGKLEVDCAELEGKRYFRLTIIAAPGFDPIHRHRAVKLWLDRDTYFPARIEIFREGVDQPAVIRKFEEVKLNVGLTPEDFKFEGLQLGWDLSTISIPKGDKLGALKATEPKLEASSLEPAAWLAALDRAVAQVKDYRTELNLELRYHRLRLIKKEEVLFIRDGDAFSALNQELQANYILLNAGPGFRTVHDPKQDRLLHVLPAGVMKVMGEQTFPMDDPRLISTLGDAVQDLSFPALRDRLARALADPASARVMTATYDGGAGPWIEVVDKNRVPKRPSVIRLLLDPVTNLPRRLELRGYDDPEAYLKASFDRTAVNQGLTNEQLWK